MIAKCLLGVEITSDEFEAAVARVRRRHGVTREALFTDRHKRPSLARGELCGILRHTFGLSYPVIGTLIGRDHTTVIYYVKLFELGVDEHVRAHLARVAAERTRVCA